MKKIFEPCLFLLPLLLAMPLLGQPAVTVYNDGFGVVRDAVPLDLEEGVNDVSYSGVTTQLEPESVVLRDPRNEVDLSVLEQSYRGDPVDREMLLQMFEGETIEFLKKLDDREVVEKARIIRAPTEMRSRDSNGRAHTRQLAPIIEMDGQIRTGLPGEPLFPSLGDDSVLLPTLSWKLFSDRSATFEAQLSYLTGGLSWKADYNLVLPEEGDGVVLTGWVSIRNNTGKTFEDARVKLIAGDVNKVDESKGQGRSADRMMALEAAPQPEREVAEKKFDAFHMYTLPGRTTLRDRETKQVEFIRAESVKTEKTYVYDGAKLPGHWQGRGGVQTNDNYGSNANPDVALYREFKNTEENGLGVPLPGGRTRFYRMDDDGQLEFTGENTIDHTPKNEDVRVYLGNAFDLVGERTRTRFSRHRSRDEMEESFEIEIRNRSEERVEVQVVEHMYRWVNYEIIEKSREFEKRDARTIEFPVQVEPDEIKTVSYTVRYSW
ncbi:MAG: DUF4139 domain-containing protein [Opitutales bacterium]